MSHSMYCPDCRSGVKIADIADWLLSVLQTLTPQSRFQCFFFAPSRKTSFSTLMARDRGLARDKPLKRSQIEETMTIKPSTRRTAPKKAETDVAPPKNKRKSNAPRRKSAKKHKFGIRKSLKRSTTRFILLILI